MFCLTFGHEGYGMELDMEYSRSYYRHQRFVLRKRDEVLVDKILDLTNLGGAGLIFGQFVNSEFFRFSIFMSGIFIVVVIYSYAWYYLSRFN